MKFYERYREKSTLKEDLSRDIHTLKTLDGKGRIQFLFDYYRWKILVSIFVIFTIILIAHMLYEGQRPYRLRICAVLNTEDNPSPWFRSFEKKLTSDGSKYGIDLNRDQPFDYDNQYYYLQELEVMTTISSCRMDAAICNADMYSYLLALNACLPLDQLLTGDEFSDLVDRGMISQDTANLQIDEEGQTDASQGIPGYYGILLDGTAFDAAYNSPAEGQEKEPLYAVIISNTEALEDCHTLLLELIQ